MTQMTFTSCILLASLAVVKSSQPIPDAFCVDGSCHASSGGTAFIQKSSLADRRLAREDSSEYGKESDTSKVEQNYTFNDPVNRGASSGMLSLLSHGKPEDKDEKKNQKKEEKYERRTAGSDAMVDFEKKKSKIVNQTKLKNGVNRSFTKYNRPEWQKTYACHSESMEGCEECWTDTNCFTAGNAARGRDARSIIVTPGTDYACFRNTIHVRCNSDKLSLRYDFEMDDKLGQVRFLWDEKEMSTSAEGMELHGDNLPSSKSARGDVQITLETKGAHILTLEFCPDQKKMKKKKYANKILTVNFTQLEMYMDETFIQCEDSKSCLEVLPVKHEAAKQLRQDNAIQLQCLNGALDSETSNDEYLLSDACNAWKECLQKGNAEDTNFYRIKTILEAVDPSTFKESASSASFLSTSLVSDATSLFKRRMSYRTRKDDGECIEPFLEDPESWGCDCFDNVMALCDSIKDKKKVKKIYTDSRCVRAAICSQDHVCADWKAEECTADFIDPLQKALEKSAVASEELLQSAATSVTELNQQAALLEHAHFDEERTGALNQATMMKSCN